MCATLLERITLTSSIRPQDCSLYSPIFRKNQWDHPKTKIRTILAQPPLLFSKQNASEKVKWPKPEYWLGKNKAFIKGNATDDNS